MARSLPSSSDTTAFAIFAATGVAVVLPGNLLPVLLTQWGMTDERAGFLFLIFFLTSTGGALLARGSLSRAIALGCLFIAVGIASLAFVSRTAAAFSIALYGLGLGITMTSVSLRQSREHPRERPTQMARLNLLWAAGACAGPVTVLRGSAIRGPAALLFGIASIFLVFGLLSLLLIPTFTTGPAPNTPSPISKATVPFELFLLVPLATGIESGTGGWLATYSGRSGHGLGLTITAVTCFWAGMLLSRMAQSYGSVAASSRNLVLRAAPAAITIGLLLILFVHNGLPELLGALLLGSAAGPLYPLLIALFLDFGEARNSVFVLGGVGASLFPWLTGLVSTHTHSLRAGLSILLLASTSLAAFGWRLSYRAALLSRSDLR
jgi:MFS transporter, FHS family, glucose/mannose:H+ symporter